MTHSDIHMAVRLLLRRTRYQSFQVGISSSEHHVGRVLVEYEVYINGIDRRFRSADPKRLLAWVRDAIKVSEVDEEPPPALIAIGGPPRLRSVK